jgi:hypothetical protein
LRKGYDETFVVFKLKRKKKKKKKKKVVAESRVGSFTAFLDHDSDPVAEATF